MIGLATFSTAFCCASKSSLSASWFSSNQSMASCTAFNSVSLSPSSILSANLSSTLFFKLYKYPSSELRPSMRSLIFLSSSAFSSASCTMRSISSWDKRPFSAVIVIFSALPVPLSSADTCKIPLASTSNVTSIWGTPRGAGGIPVNSNLPRMWLSLVIVRSPSYTWIDTAGWLSWYVENVCDFFVGTTVLRLMILVMTPPTVSIPNDNGATSNNKMSCVVASFSPPKIPPWTAAPYATASSGLMPREGSLPLKKSLINCWILGIRVDPPTSTISSTSFFFKPASFITFSTGLNVFLNKSLFNSSKRARVNVSSKSSPSKSDSISRRAWGWVDNARLTRSASRRSFCNARLSLEMSIFFCFCHFLMKNCMMR
ncbi:hypothetical protein H257_17475 [Aphanomyces astaci]|uniref:Uncharacterized protein n=1 Tax=Aphanomyces astaci TaxID=112090 RepID=W4FGF2_APHAT|nr:hypothetical protein H257_17475 [Aphanomyces astaci]ETV65926.1 hypothetical protein H257_17475 [Aphanomyces astaci]|eukprot:XP_009844581.1 hypothetical protein H257_17475 [Aphanomyces astaci]